MTETATATNPTEASASTETSATLLATADNGTGNTQQTPPAETQQQPAGEQTADGSQRTELVATAGAPEAYTFTPPEGSTYDPEILTAFSGAAKKANLTQEAAQQLIEEMAPALAARQIDQVKAIHEEWSSAVAADTELGGDKMRETLGVARKALDSFKTSGPPLLKLLNDTGLGNHPDVLRYLLHVGQAISEDKIVTGAQKGSNSATVASVLYDKTEKG